MRNGAYTFTTTTTDSEERFILHFTPPAIILTEDASCEQAGLSGMVRLRIYNITGEQLWSNETAYNAGSWQKKIDLTDLSDGIYVLELESQGDVRRQKFIITK